MYIPDEMHCKHLGADKSFAGSVLRNLTHHVLGGSEAANLKTIWREVQVEYKQTRTQTRFQVITANMIQGKKKLPELRGKAAQIRALLPILVTVWKNI